MWGVYVSLCQGWCKFNCAICKNNSNDNNDKSNDNNGKSKK